MKKAILAALVAALISGCGAIQFKSPAQQEIVMLTVSVAAKAIGLKLASQGFIWAPEIETFYRMIRFEDKISLDAAQLAERYISDQVDPLLAPDLIKLASMVGFQLDPMGHVVGIDKVDPGLLRTAADGFRLAVLSRS